MADLKLQARGGIKFRVYAVGTGEYILRGGVTKVMPPPHFRLGQACEEKGKETCGILSIERKCQ